MELDLYEIKDEATSPFEGGDLEARLQANWADAAVKNEEDWNVADIKDTGNPILLQLNDNVAPTYQREFNKLHYILEKVSLSFFASSWQFRSWKTYSQLDFIICRITRSSSWRNELNRIMDSQGLLLGSLIAGHEIQCNIKYISWHEDCLASEVCLQFILFYFVRIRIISCYTLFKRWCISFWRKTLRKYTHKLNGLVKMPKHTGTLGLN